MELVSGNHQHTESTAPAISIPLEWVAWALLIAAALLIRLVALDITPLSDPEAARALASWHALTPTAPGTAPAADSAMTFWLQAGAFSILGGGDGAARLAGVIGGLVLVLLPLAFRPQIGAGPAFLFSLLLAFSPTAIAASRTADPAVWSLSFALIALVALWRYTEMRHATDGVLLIASLGALIFLSESAGPWLALLLVAATAIALWWSTLQYAADTGESGETLAASIREGLQTVPWLRGLALVALLVIIVSTAFMTYFGGFDLMTQALGGALTLPVEAYHPNAPFAYPLLIVLTYEPLLVAFGIAGLILLKRQDRWRGARRLLIAWLGLALLASFFLRGLGPGAALWLIVPLAGLGSITAAALTTNRPPAAYWYDADYEEDSETLASKVGWIKWALAPVVAGLLLVMSVHVADVARSLISLPPDTTLASAFSFALEPNYARMRVAAIWVIFSVLFLLVGFFLVTSVWGQSHAWQSLGLGVLLTLLISGAGTGWNITTTRASNPAELWTIDAIQPDAALLRDTIQEISRRDTRGFPELAITLVEDGEIVRDDGLLAWLLRDYPEARFVPTIEDARRDQIVLMAPVEGEPDLGGSYVGQSFALRQHWPLTSVSALDIPAWLTQRRIRSEATEDRVVLWLRQDVFNVTPIETRPAG